MNGRVLQLPEVDGEPIIDFPVFRREEWLSLDRALSWDHACASIGVTRSQLRTALDAARKHAGPDPLSVEGICNGVRFHAERPSAQRGVAWRFYLHRDVKSAGARMSDLRHHVRNHHAGGVRRLPARLLVPVRWAWRTVRRAS